MVVLKDKNNPELKKQIEKLQERWSEPHSGVKAVRKTIDYFLNEVPKLQKKYYWYFEQYEKLTKEIADTKETLINFTHLLNNIDND